MKRTRINTYLDPALLARVRTLAIRRNVAQSAVIEAAVASFLSADATEQLEAALTRRLDRISRQLAAMDDDIVILGETVALFVRFWLTITPPLPESAKPSAKAKGAERFDGFIQSLGRRLAAGDRFLKEVSRDIAPGSEVAPQASTHDPEDVG